MKYYVNFFIGLSLFVSANTFSINETQLGGRVLHACLKVVEAIYQQGGIEKDEVKDNYVAYNDIMPIFKDGGRFEYENYKNLSEKEVNTLFNKEEGKALVEVTPRLPVIRSMILSKRR